MGYKAGAKEVYARMKSLIEHQSPFGGDALTRIEVVRMLNKITAEVLADFESVTENV
jgi:hypothetical protein